MSRLHLVMPMGGSGMRFFENGFITPKPLIQIYGQPFFYWATQSIRKFVDDIDIIFVVLEEHIVGFNIDKEIKKYYPEAEIKVLPQVLPGAVYTCLKGIEDIEDDIPVLFNDCDHMFCCDRFYKMINGGNAQKFGEAVLLTFKSRQPQFSYVKYDPHGNVCSTVEKQVVSDHAICGAYYFGNADLFREAARIYIDSCQYKECFVSGVYNVLCSQGKRVQDILTDYHESFGTPEEYMNAQKKGKFRRFI